MKIRKYDSECSRELHITEDEAGIITSALRRFQSEISDGIIMSGAEDAEAIWDKAEDLIEYICEGE